MMYIRETEQNIIGTFLQMMNVPYERKINILPSTDNNFRICLFDFERFSIESRFPFLKLTLYTCTLVSMRSTYITLHKTNMK